MSKFVSSDENCRLKKTMDCLSLGSRYCGFCKSAIKFCGILVYKMQKICKVSFGQCHWVFVLHKSFLWFKNQECGLTLGVFIKLSNETIMWISHTFTIYIPDHFDLSKCSSKWIKRDFCVLLEILAAMRFLVQKSGQQLSVKGRMSLHLSLIIVWFVRGFKNARGQ